MMTPVRDFWDRTTEAITDFPLRGRRWPLIAAEIFRSSMRRGPAAELVILDDYFPHPLSAFRFAEFTAYLDVVPRTLVFSTARKYRSHAADLRPFCKIRRDFEQRYPNHRHKIHQAFHLRHIRGGLAYCVFLANARTYLPLIERSRIPFVFTLYPGGSFLLNNEKSDAALESIVSSRWCRGLIATQPVTRDYLLEKSWMAPEKLVYIYGGVFPDHGVTQEKRLVYRRNKSTFDICFVAAKYMPRGLDKGYDVFIETARKLCRAVPDILFHVVGGFSESDIDVSDFRHRIRFYGMQHPSFFHDFYRRMDCIVSPNAAFAFKPGAFDGFPTGCCIEAAMSGVVPCCTDPLKMNRHFRDGHDMVVVDRDPEMIASRIVSLFQNPEMLANQSLKAQESFQRVFGMQAQIVPRLEFLNKCRIGSG